MKSIYKIAWRNLWRNKRRTLITSSSIIIAVVLAVATRSMQHGSYDNMIANTIKFTTGHIQIHKKGYWEKKSINRIFFSNDLLVSKLKSTHPKYLIPRLTSFALCSAGKHTKGVIVRGIAPEVEDSVAGLSRRITKGKYLSSGGKGVILGDKLASFLNISVGDSLVLLGQGYHGVTAAGLYPVSGISHFPSKEINSSVIFMSLPESQKLYFADGGLTSYSMIYNNANNLDEKLKLLKENLTDKYEIMTWEELNPELVQIIETDSNGGIFMLGIVYLIIGFGIFGTLLMMTLERRKEFAIMIAVGLRRSRLRLILLWETIYLSIFSSLSGVLLGIPLVAYFHYNPIKMSGELSAMMEEYGADPFLPFAFKADIFIYQAVVVLIIAFIAAVYPIWKINKLKILKALRD